jgi:hypothetical protein
VYRHVDAALVRAAAYPSGLALPPPPDVPADAAAAAGQWRHWLQQVWAQEAVAQAVELASPVLARSVRELCGGHAVEPRQVRRIAVSLYATCSACGIGPRRSACSPG